MQKLILCLCLESMWCLHKLSYCIKAVRHDKSFMNTALHTVMWITAAFTPIATAPCFFTVEKTTAVTLLVQ